MDQLIFKNKRIFHFVLNNFWRSSSNLDWSNFKPELSSNLKFIYLSKEVLIIGLIKMTFAARILPIARRHPIIKHGILFTAVLPISAATFSIYHATQSPFFMKNKPPESWNNYDNIPQKLYTTQDLSNYRSDRPYFEYNF